MFKYEAVGSNTPENRKHLKNLGYKPNIISCNDEMLYTREFVHGWMYNGCPYMTIPNHYINCIDNDELFRAVSAISDETDFMQWFTNGKAFELCLHNSFASNYNGGLDGCIRKASLKELKEHFKK